MRILRNGSKRHVYLSASERRALNRALNSVRCLQCNSHHLGADNGYRAISCLSCGWWAVIGKDIFLSYAKMVRWDGNIITRVQAISTVSGNVVYNVPTSYRSSMTYGDDIRL